MNNQARQHLYQLINDHGIEVTKDLKRFESLFKDYTLGQYKREIFLCVQAAREGVIEALQNNKHQPYQMVAARLTKQLHDDYGLDFHAAKWAVGSWVVVLGLTNKFPPPKPKIKLATINKPSITAPIAALPTKATNLIPPKKLIVQKNPLSGRYLDRGDDTIFDISSNLLWMRYSLGQKFSGKVNLGDPKRYTWQEALDAAEELNQSGGFAGYQDWRVPSIDELKTLVERGKKPAINHTMFPETPSSLFWSSTTASNVNHSAWAVYFYGGNAYWYGKTSYYFVRLVRN